MGKLSLEPLVANNLMEGHTSPELQSRTLIRAAPFFKGLPEAAAQKALARVVTCYHPVNKAILRENDWGSSVYCILSGWVKIQTYNLDGKEVTLNILGPGELFGEMAALDKVPRSTDVITLKPTVVGNVPACDFVNLVYTEPQAGIQLARLMARRLRQVNRRLCLREADSRARVADILLFLAEDQGKQSCSGVEIPHLSHRELSRLSGMARETVTRVLGKLEKQGLIQRDQDILRILDIDALESMLI